MIGDIRRVFNDSRASGTHLLTMLALADYANEAGIAFPAVSTLAVKCRLSERQMKRVLRELAAMGELEVARGAGRNGTNHYRLRPGAGVSSTSPRGVIHVTPGGDIGGTKLVSPVTPKAPVKHHGPKAPVKHHGGAAPSARAAALAPHRLTAERIVLDADVPRSVANSLLESHLARHKHLTIREWELFLAEVETTDFPLPYVVEHLVETGSYLPALRAEHLHGLPVPIAAQ